MISVKVKGDLDGIKAKSSAIKQRVTTFVGDELLRKSEPYIPLDTSMLRDSGVMHSDRKKAALIWKTPYAKPQWEYGTGRHNNATGLRGKKWALRAWADHHTTILTAAQRMIRGQ